MSSKKQWYSPAAGAALLRVAMETAIKPVKAEEYADLIFNIFKITGKDSYEKLLEMMQEENNIQLLAETINNLNHPAELLEFAKAFMGNMPNKIEDEEAEEVFVKNNNDENEEGEFIEFTDFNSDMNIEFPNIQSKEKGTLHILDCEIKTQTLSDMQCFQYIEVPVEPFNELEDDFNIAEHLKALSEINANSDASGKLLLVCESKYTGLLACRYLSSMVSEIEYDEEDEEYEIRFANKLPVINASQIDSYMQQGMNNSPYCSGGFEFQSIQNINCPVPWWMRHEEVPIIVLINKNLRLSAEFTNKLKILGQMHSSIIIIHEEEEDNGTQVINNQKTHIFGTDLNKIVEEISFKLTYNTYQIKDPDINSEYMKKVFKDAAYLNNYEIEESVNIGELLKLLKKCLGKGWEGNSSVVQLIRKAISMKKNKHFGILSHEDFAFLEHSLVVVKNKDTQKKQEGKTENAVQRMNRCIIGLDNVKQRILEIVNALKNNQKSGEKESKTGKINNVHAFYGPPGVGKTEMAQYFMEIMFENNLLPGKRFININGAQLKGAFVGQTAPKVASIFETYDAIFIDEAYSLTAKDFSMDTFSQEALAELCVQLERHAKEKLIIFAGYGGDVAERNNKMKDFLDSNPGIASRVAFHVNFPSYSPDNEMPKIFKRIVDNSGYTLEDGWEGVAVEFFKEKKKSESFGNAREARKLLERAIVAQSKRRLIEKALDVDTFKLATDVDSLKLINVEDIRNAAKDIMASEGKLYGTQRTNTIGF